MEARRPDTPSVHKSWLTAIVLYVLSFTAVRVWLDPVRPAGVTDFSRAVGCRGASMVTLRGHVGPPGKRL